MTGLLQGWVARKQALRWRFLSRKYIGVLCRTVSGQGSGRRKQDVVRQRESGTVMQS